MHGEWPNGEVDHINGHRDDNRISNLRVLSSMQNKQNQRNPRSDNTTGYLGVTWLKREQRYRAGIQHQGRFIHVGTFKTAEEAHAAYVERKRLIHEACTI